MASSEHIPAIIAMRREGVSVKEIHRRLVQVGYTKSYSTLRRHVAKLESNNPSKTQLYRPRRHYDHYPEILNTIVRAYVSDSSTPSSSIRNQLLGKGITVSSRQVRRLRKMLGFERRTPQYCQLIRHTSRLKRIEFCSHMLAMKETFTDCIFADESTIQVDANVRRCYARKEDETSRFRPRAKHPAKVHIWGGISARGTTDLVLFPGSTRMDSSMYCEILEASCLKFINRRYHDMSDHCIVAFFPRTKTVDVISSDAVQGDISVGATRKVIWKERPYTAKIVFAGPRAICEEKVTQVTSDGNLEEPRFHIDERPSSPREDNECSCCRTCTQETRRRLDEVLDRIKEIEVSMAERSLERNVRSSLEAMTAKLAETNILLRKINYNTARPSEEEPNFALMSKEKVARIRKLRGDNMTKFALDMENELFAGDREELEKPIEKRIESADKVQFIRECVFMFYEIREAAKKETWANIRNALNSRARKRRRKSAAFSDENPICYTPEPLGYDSN